MPENQKKTPRSKLPKRNPDSKPNSDTTPTSDGQTQRPEMADNGREIEFPEPNSDTTPVSDGQIQRPEMADNGREIEFPEPNSDTTPTSDGQTQRPEMADNGREIEFPEPNSDTTPASDGQTQRPEMADNGREIDRLRQESYDLACQQAQAAMPMCLSILADAALESPDPALRLRAARYLLSWCEVRRGRQPQGAPQVGGRRLPFRKDRLSLGIASIFGTLSARMIAFQFRWFPRLRSVIPASAGIQG